MGDLQADAEAAQRQAAEAKKESPWRMVLLAVSAAAFVLVMALNVAPMFRPVEALPEAEQEVSLDAMAQMVVHRIEAYWDAQGELPASLDALGLPLEGFDYTPLGETYELVARAGEAEVVYSAGDPVPTLPGDETHEDPTTDPGGETR